MKIPGAISLVNKMKERLLKRIRNWETAESNVIAETDVNDLMVSLQDDLEKLFNTRLGTVLVDPDYGLPDFSNMFNSYVAPDTDEIRMALATLTKKYETRLSSIEIKFDDDKKSGDDLKFILNSKLDYKNQKLPFSVNAFLRDDGSIVLGR